jgi:hypothetical protein
MKDKEFAQVDSKENWLGQLFIIFKTIGEIDFEISLWTSCTSKF